MFWCKDKKQKRKNETKLIFVQDIKKLFENEEKANTEEFAHRGRKYFID